MNIPIDYEIVLALKPQTELLVKMQQLNIVYQASSFDYSTTIIEFTSYSPSAFIIVFIIP